MEERVKATRQSLEEAIDKHKEKIAFSRKNFEREGLIPLWPNYNAVRQFKSVRRAIRRGHVNLFSGMIYPDRPYNNRKPTKGRGFNELRKRIYEQYKRAI